MSFEGMSGYVNIFTLFNQCPIFFKLICLNVVLLRVLLHQCASAVKFAIDCLYGYLRAVVLYDVSPE